MSKRRTIFLLVVCFSIAVFAVQTLSQTPMPRRTPNMTDAEWKKEIEKWRAQNKLEREQWRKESKKRSEERRRKWELGREQRRLDREKRRKERKKMWEKKKEEAGGFIFEKSALGATNEQWKLIKPKLEKARQLREQANSAVGAFIASGSNDRPAFQWKRPWKDKAPAELTEAQKLAKELTVLLEKKNTTPEAFRRKIAALRKTRVQEADIKRQLAEAQRELRGILTTRQEAALVLMGRL